MIVVPIVVVIVCAGGAFAAAVRWLPPLADDSVGVIAGFAVAGLLGAAAGAVGLTMYMLAHELHNFSSGGPFSNSKGELVANHLESALYYGGVLTGLAGVVYLLAPRKYPDGPRPH